MILKKKALVVAMSAATALLLAACDGDDGRDGTNGTDGADGANGASSLISQTQLLEGNAECQAGGVRIDSGMDLDTDGVLDSNEITETSYVCEASPGTYFQRIATQPICEQIDASCNTDTETAAEIVAASEDGLTLIYTDSPEEQVGFVDITNPADPEVDGILALGGEPTSVAVSGDYALVGVNTSTDFVTVSGQMDVVDIATKTIVTSIDVGGQPDSLAVSKDDRYAAVVIENERDEDLGDGAPPQLPAGELVIVDMVGAPAAWTTRRVDLTGLADLFPTDPEPEYVDINDENIAVVTLQENNYIVLVDLTDGSIVNHFTAGTVDLTQIDATEEDPAIISLTEAQSLVPREPDGVSWLSTELFATADEGDLDGGSRGFTVFNTAGDVVFSSGNSLDHLAVRFGHYPDGRSGNKGNEPENVEYGEYGDNKFLFVNSERSSLVFVYDVTDPANPVYVQTLPAAVGPEGVLAIPSRNLLVAASEKDDRGDKIRSGLNIYSYDADFPQYPTIASANNPDGTPIAWSAMSGLSSDSTEENTLYAVEDSFYGMNRIFKLDVSVKPAQLSEAITIMDSNDILAAVPVSAASSDDAFDQADLDAMINADKSVNIDPEGVAKASDGGFWVVSEGSGTVGDASRPVTSLNFLFKLDSTGVIEHAITLPDAINDMQLRFGFEGVTEYNGSAYVAFQRVWGTDTNVRIGVYDTAAQSWSFLFYPLDAAESQNGGWVGLSDITSLGNGEFLVLERDNQGGPDAAIKRIYRVDTNGATDGTVLTKTLVRDLLTEGDLTAMGGLPYEKLEGMALMSDGDVFIINDNDGVDDNSGETQLINLGDILN